MLPRKKVKREQPQPRLTRQTAQPTEQQTKKVIVSFTDHTGKSFGQFQFDTDDGPQQFQQVIDGLVSEEDQEQYNFFFKTKEIKNKLGIFFQQTSYRDYEATLAVTCFPVSSFRVKPVTRATTSLFGHTEAVLSIQFSPDSQNLASGSGDGTVRLWDVYTQTPLEEIRADNWVMIVQWSPCGEKLAYADKNGKITIRRLSDKSEVELNGHTKWVTSLAWRPIHLDKQCNRLVSGSKDFTLRLWDTNSGCCLRSFGQHTKCITKVLWSGSDQIYSSSEDQHVNVFSRDGTFQKSLKKHGHWVNTMSLSTDYVLKRSYFDPSSTGQPLVTLDEKHKKALQLYSKATQHHSERLVTGSDDFTLILYNLPTPQPIRQMVGHGKPVNHVQFSPDGRYICSGSFDRKVKLWDGYSGQFMYTFTGHVGPVYLMTWSADSRFLISGSQDSTMKLWDMKTRKLMLDLPGHADQVYALDWSSDGRLVASGGKDRQVKLWAN